MNFPEAFEKNIQSKKLLCPGEKILVACSGGPDSVALTHLLAGLRHSWNIKPVLIHFNHQLRGRASSRDEQFVKKLARKLKLRCFMGRLNVQKMAAREKFSIEEAARKARYDFFMKTARKHHIQKIATAHTLDDQAETVLMRLLQGTGLRGLCGVREQIRQGRALLVRPLLGFSKPQILEYLRQKKITYCKDTSNHQLRFLRNRIRKKLLPFLQKEFHPQAAQLLARIPQSLWREVEALSFFEERFWKDCFLKRQKNAVHLKKKVFLKHPPALQFRVLDRALKVLEPKSGMEFRHWEILEPHLSKTSFRCSLPRSIDLALTRSHLRLYKK